MYREQCREQRSVGPIVSRCIGCVSVARIRREGVEIRSCLVLSSNGGPASTPVRGAVGRSCWEWLSWEGRIDSHITSLC